MGFGALIGGVVSAAGGIAGSLLSKSGASQASGNATEAGHQINVARNRYILPFTGKDYWSLDMPGAVQQSFNVGQQFAPQFNQVNQANLLSMLSNVLPGWQGMVGQMGQNVSQELAGQVPADVQNQIQRFAAQQGITSGIGAGGAAGGAAGAPFQLGVKDVTARDLGLTSLSMTQQGQAGLGNLLGMAKNYLMPQPVSAQSILPFQDIIAGQQYTQQATFDANLAAFNASVLGSTTGLLGQVPQQSQLAGIAGGIGGLLQGLGQTNPQTGLTGYQQIGGLFSGLGGQSGSAGMTLGGVGAAAGGASDLGSLGLGLF